MERVVLKEETMYTEPFPTWKLSHGDITEILRNQISLRECVNQIFEQAKGDIEIRLHLQPYRNKPQLKALLFAGRAYFSKIKVG